MKSVNNNNNWLGFSLSPHPHINVELSSSEPVHHHQSEPSPSSVSVSVPNAVQNNLFLSPIHLNTPSLCFEGDNIDNGGHYYSQLSTMPLKSDVSLCIMEAFTRSQNQSMVASPSTKLEDFLGGGQNMGTHHQYGNNDAADHQSITTSMYYQQNQDQADHAETNCNRRNLQPLDLLQQSSYFQPLQQGMMQQVSEMYNHHHQHPPLLELESVVNDGYPTLNKNWASVGGGMYCGELQSLSLSMSPGSQTSCAASPQPVISNATNYSINGEVAGDHCMGLEVSKKRAAGGKAAAHKQPVHRKSIDTFGQRTSQYRGVTRHRWTGRYEAHLWDNSCKREGQTRKGRQVYLGGYDMEEKAARAYDLAALKYWGPSTHINFPLDNYPDELEEMKNMSRQEYVAHLRRKSSGFSRGASIYRGVTRHHQHGRWQARIGRVAGNKDLYLGTFSTQEDAAEAYDIAAIKFRGASAITNFEITRYDVEKIMSSNTLLTGVEVARKKKAIDEGQEDTDPAAGSDWKMMMVVCNEVTADPPRDDDVQSSHNAETTTTTTTLLDHRHTKPFSVLVGGIIESVNNYSQILDESRNAASSSIVTSLNNNNNNNNTSSSREGSPVERTGFPTTFYSRTTRSTHEAAAMFGISPSTTPPGSSSWIPSTHQLSSASDQLHASQIPPPLFAAWTD